MQQAGRETSQLVVRQAVLRQQFIVRTLRDAGAGGGGVLLAAPASPDSVICVGLGQKLRLLMVNPSTMPKCTQADFAQAVCHHFSVNSDFIISHQPDRGCSGLL